MNITKTWLEEKSSGSYKDAAGRLYKDKAEDVIEWFEDQYKVDVGIVLEEMIKQGKLSHAGWLVTQCMTYNQRIQYVGFAADQIDIHEKLLSASNGVACVASDEINSARHAFDTVDSIHVWNPALYLKIIEYGITLMMEVKHERTSS